MQLVQGGSVGRLDAHDVSIIVQPGQSLPGHVSKGRFLGLLLAQETGPTFKTVDPIHVESGSPQRIQFHGLRVGIAAVYSVFVRHVSAASSSRASSFCSHSGLC